MSLKFPRWLKISAVAAAGILAAIFIGLLVYLKTIDLNRYADLIDAQIESATGRDFRSGKLGLNIFPGIELVAEDVHLSNAAWGSDAEMISVKRLDGRIAILPLLQQRLEIDRFVVIGATILIEENEKGNSNWRFGSSRPQESPEAPEEASAFELGGLDEVSFEDTVLVYRRPGMTEPMRLDIRRLEIIDGRLSQKNHFKLDALFRGQPFTASGSAGRIAGMMKKGRQWPLDIDFDTEGASAKIRSQLDWSSSPPSAQGDIDIAIEDATGLEKLLQRSLGLPLPLEVAAKVDSVEGQYRIDPIKSTVGTSRISGYLNIKTVGKRPVLEANLQTASLDLSGRKPSGRSPQKSDGRVFSDAPFPLEILQKIDAVVEVSIDRFVLTNRLPLEAVRLSASLQDGQLRIHPLSVSVGGGRIDAEVDLEASDPKAALLSIKADGKGISGEKLAAAMGYANTISGADTDGSIHLSGPGTSLAGFMAGVNGEALLVVGPGVFKGKALDWGGDTLTKLADLVNPFRRQEKQTTLVCGVIRLPARGGIVTVNRSIAMETNRLTMVAAGQINLRTETLNLGFKSHAKEGIGIGAVNLADLVRVSGPLSKPSVGADTVESAKKALSVGGALVTGGLSLLGEALYKKTTADRNPCRTALSGGGSKPSAATNEKKKQKAEGGILDSIKNLFGQ